MTPLDFARALLNRLGLPQSSNNLVSLVAFVGIEAGHWNNKARFNPLNTTQTMPGSTKAPGTIVQAYTSWTQGVEASAKTLTNGLYGGLIAALKESADPQTFLRALSDSRWCSAPSTVSDRSPECGTEEGKGVPCYCNYAKFSAKALYNEWANRPDPVGGAIAPIGPQIGGLAILFGAAILIFVVWYKFVRRV